MSLADRHRLFVVEDAAEAHGAIYRGRVVGSIGHIGTFSFFGNKVISTGEGGMVTTDDEDLARLMRQLKEQGMDPNRRYWYPVVGYNYRMTNITAAIGLAQVEKIDWHIQRRIEARPLVPREPSRPFAAFPGKWRSPRRDTCSSSSPSW